jgi:predicted aspartyl protease
VARSGPRNPDPGALGVIADGAHADLLLIDGDPLRDLSVREHPETLLALIMKDGRIDKDLVRAHRSSAPIDAEPRQGGRMVNLWGMSRARRILGAVAVVLAAAFAQPSGAADAPACKLVQMAEMPVETAGNRVIVIGEINGQPARILIDTGSSSSMIWRPSAKRYGLHLRDASQVRVWGVGGESYVQQAEVASLKIDRFVASKMTLPVAGDVEQDFDMILGVNFFGAVAIEFDLPHRKVRLLQGPGCKPAQFAYWARTFPEVDLVSKPVDSGRVEMVALLNGQPVSAMLESGAPLSTVAAEDAARVGVTKDAALPDSEHRMGGIGTGQVDTWIGTFQTFSLGAETIRNARLRIAELSTNTKDVRLGSRLARQVVRFTPLMLGVDFLLSHRVVVVGPERKMYFTYEGGPVFQTVAPTPPPDPVVPAPAAGDSGG